MIPKIYQGELGAGVAVDYTPNARAVQRMMRYNERLADAGVLIALDGLHPPGTGARVAFGGGNAQVTDGPFTESKEVLGGYWIIRADSLEQAVEWARQCPAEDGDVIEIREIFETEEWPEDSRRAAESAKVQSALGERVRQGNHDSGERPGRKTWRK
ncbi:MAG: YciI family protein [Spirochaetales bacterium]|nr:YciI family protein [Spirochaetales bacterium]